MLMKNKEKYCCHRIEPRFSETDALGYITHTAAPIFEIVVSAP